MLKNEKRSTSLQAINRIGKKSKKKQELRLTKREAAKYLLKVTDERGVVTDANVKNFLNGKLSDELSEALRVLDFSIGVNGTLYHRNKNGVLPDMMRNVYDKRKMYKNKKLDAEKKLAAGGLSETEVKRLEHEVSINSILDKSMKVVLNSAYGAIGSEYFRFYSTPMAEAITITGQFIIRWVAKYINEYLNSIMGNEKPVDYVCYSDTDSEYVLMDDIIDKFLPNADKEKIVDFLDVISRDKIEGVIQKSFDDLSQKLNAMEPEALVMKREIIADSGVWQAKKRYALNVLDSEGTRYIKKPKMKIMGMETAKSSTPAVIRQHMEELLYAVLNENEESCQKLIRKIKSKFKKYSIEDISFPRSMNNLGKYRSYQDIYKKGTPIHVRGALLFNHYLKQWNLDKQYDQIKDGEKIKFIMLKEPNPIHENVLSYVNVFPRESGLDKYIDWELMFQKTFIEPMTSVFDVIGWTVEKRSTLEDMFA